MGRTATLAMSDIERIERRLSTVERAVVDGDLELAAVDDAASSPRISRLSPNGSTHTSDGSAISRTNRRIRRTRRLRRIRERDRREAG